MAEDERLTEDPPDWYPEGGTHPPPPPGWDERPGRRGRLALWWLRLTSQPRTIRLGPLVMVPDQRPSVAADRTPVPVPCT